jgi:hypothetical protein
LGTTNRMAQPKHKAREVKKKTVFDRLKESALFILLMIILMIVDIVAFIFWLSGLLSGQLQNKALVTDTSFLTFAGLAVFLALFFGVAWLVQRRAHGPRTT